VPDVWQWLRSPNEAAGRGEAIILKSGTVSALECLHYALSLSTSVVITGIDNQRALDQAFEAAKSFHPLNREQISRLLAKTAAVAKEGHYELFKTTSHFDSPAKHPDWLGGILRLCKSWLLLAWPDNKTAPIEDKLC
jgi:hypothetical protein